MNNPSTANPCFKLLLDKKMKQTISSVRRLNDEGTLYYMDCTEKYDRTLFKAVFKLMGKIKYTGCSAFIAENPTGGYSVGRNYDLPHKDDKKDSGEAAKKAKDDKKEKEEKK